MSRVIVNIVLPIAIGIIVAYVFEWIRGASANGDRSRRLILFSISILIAFATLTPLVWICDWWGEGLPLASWQMAFLSLLPVSLALVGSALYLSAWRRLIAVSQQASNAQFLQQDMRKFVADTKERISDPVMQLALLCAREAIQDVALSLDGLWDRGRHTLVEGAREIKIVPDDQSTAEIAFAIEKSMIAHLSKLPYAIESSKGGAIVKRPDSAYTWVINPLEGGRHLMRHLPLFAITIALVDGDYSPIISMVYVPPTGELFFAVKDFGAYLNDWKTSLPLSVETSSGPFVYVEFPNLDFKNSRSDEFDKQCACLKEVFATTPVWRVRGFGHGSIGLAYVAKGSFAAYVTLSGKTRRCHVLAGALLVSEAHKRAASSKIVLVTGKEDERARCYTEVYVVSGTKYVCEALLRNPTLKQMFSGSKEPRQ